MSEQRLRVYFRKGDRVRYISHLDVLRFWERAIRRAGLPLSYSKGFSPHPKLHFAGPLPLGFTAGREIMDVFLDERVSAEHFREAMLEQSNHDLEIVEIEEVPLTTASPQAALTWADYSVDVPELAADEAQATIDRFMALQKYPWEEQRNDRTKTIDLRENVSRFGLAPLGGGTTLRIRARAGQELNVRPESLMQALFPAYTATRITRERLVLVEVSPAREAWLRRGRYQQ